MGRVPDCPEASDSAPSRRISGATLRTVAIIIAVSLTGCGRLSAGSTASDDAKASEASPTASSIPYTVETQQVKEAPFGDDLTLFPPADSESPSVSAGEAFDTAYGDHGAESVEKAVVKVADYSQFGSAPRLVWVVEFEGGCSYPQGPLRSDDSPAPTPYCVPIADNVIVDAKAGGWVLEYGLAGT